jgi:hypothetical protein
MGTITRSFANLITATGPNAIADGSIINADINASAAIATTKLGTGAVLQVVSGSTTTETGTSSSTFSDYLSVNITPTFTSSKILIIGSINGIRRDSGSAYLGVRIFDGASFNKLLTHAALYTAGSSTLRISGATASFLDSPNTTSQKTYKLQIRNLQNSGIVVVGDNNECESTITLIEIAG